MRDARLSVAIAVLLMLACSCLGRSSVPAYTQQDCLNAWNFGGNLGHPFEHPTTGYGWESGAKVGYVGPRVNIAVVDNQCRVVFDTGSSKYGYTTLRLDDDGGPLGGAMDGWSADDDVLADVLPTGSNACQNEDGTIQLLEKGPCTPPTTPGAAEPRDVKWELEAAAVDSFKATLAQVETKPQKVYWLGVRFHGKLPGGWARGPDAVGMTYVLDDSVFPTGRIQVITFAGKAHGPMAATRGAEKVVRLHWDGEDILIAGYGVDDAVVASAVSSLRPLFAGLGVDGGEDYFVFIEGIVQGRFPHTFYWLGTTKLGRPTLDSTALPETFAFAYTLAKHRVIRVVTTTPAGASACRTSPSCSLNTSRAEQILAEVDVPGPNSVFLVQRAGSRPDRHTVKMLVAALRPLP